MAEKVGVQNLITDQTTTGPGNSFEPNGIDRTYQVYGNTSSGSGSAVVKIESSNDNSHWALLASFTLTLSTTSVSEGTNSDAAWKYVRANIDSISGTDAKVTVVMGNNLR